MEWFTANLPTILTGVVLAVIVALIVWSKAKERKRGGCGCGCPGCTGSCAHAAATDRKKEEIR